MKKQIITIHLFFFWTNNRAKNKIDENEKAIAILEINPISKAHSLVIPKEHASGKMPKEAKKLAEQVSKKIKKEFNPKEVKILSSTLFGHEILNILPVYKDETQDSKRQQAKPAELEELQKALQEKPKKEIIKKPKPKKLKEKIKLPQRIP